MSRITCNLCGDEVHSIQLHLSKNHPDCTIKQYRETFPDAPILSDEARKKILAVQQAKERNKVAIREGVVSGVLHEVFQLDESNNGVRNARGEPIQISIFVGENDLDLVPGVDEQYVYDADLLKTVLMGLEANIPTYLWGHAGVGKSTIIEQICARTKRRMLRIQHTENTEESHIVGQTLANEKGTFFEPGPLPLAMRYGWTYLADEYDFAHPSILGVYQPVLEGKSLVIKEAPPEWRVTKPHADFRFVATGNTNGSGDETGLYQGTKLGNAANYSRFGITTKVDYMSRELEISVVANQSGIDDDDAEQLVDFARLIREAYDGGKMSATIGPRELIFAAKTGQMRADFRMGVMFAFINRLSIVDREAALGFLQRTVEAQVEAHVEAPVETSR